MKGKKGFQKGHKAFVGIKATQFKKGQKPWNDTQTFKVCLNCLSEFKIKPSHYNQVKFCSRICTDRYRGKIALRLDTRDKPCPDCGKMIMRKSKSCRSCHQIGIKRPYWTGANNNNWKGGITSANMTIRRSSQYKRWARQVKERDNFTCQFCGIRGGELHSDHILPFSEYPKLRLRIDNGRTLCAPCHRKTPNYGRPSKKVVMPYELQS